ncbi:MAG TPA: hypothetical protein VKZ74_05855 [Natronosporangium sp.]|nr:hypothetical protein [Natronosporangium sp.]
MNAATLLFLGIGGLGVLVLILSLLGFELFDLDGFVPMEVVAAMLSTFGFGAAIASSVLADRSTPVAVAGAAAIGVGVSLPAGWLTIRLAQAARRMPTDATPTREDLLGTTGVVVTPIPREGYGEVRVILGGQPVKLNATADTEIALGSEVFVIAAPSETSVVVERIPSASGPASGLEAAS